MVRKRALSKYRVLLGDRQGILDRYLDGEPISSLMITFGYSRRAIQVFLRREGVVLRGVREALVISKKKHKMVKYVPNEDEIAERCEGVRKGWTAETERKRKVGCPEFYTIPVIAPPPSGTRGARGKCIGG